MPAFFVSRRGRKEDALAAMPLSISIPFNKNNGLRPVGTSLRSLRSLRETILLRQHPRDAHKLRHVQRFRTALAVDAQHFQSINRTGQTFQ